MEVLPFVPLMVVMGVSFLAACCLFGDHVGSAGGRLPLDPDDAGGGTAAFLPVAFLIRSGCGAVIAVAGLGGVAVCSDDGGH